MRVTASIVLSSLLVVPGLAGAAGPVEGRSWDGRFESSGAVGELHVILEGDKAIGLTFHGRGEGREYLGQVLSSEVIEGRVVIHGKLGMHRTNSVKIGSYEPKPIDPVSGWQPVTGELTITIEGKQLPTDPFKVDVIVGTLKFAGASLDGPEWLPGTAILSSFGPH